MITCDYIKRGDCLELMRELPDKSIDLIATDPPYLIGQINGGGTVNNVMKLNQSLEDLTHANLINGYDIELYGNEFIRVMKSVNIYLWCNKAQIPRYIDFYVNEHKCKFTILCWHKTNALPTYSNKYLSDTEYLFYFHKGKGKCFPQSYENAKTYYLAPSNYKDKKQFGHPTIKPLDITERIIKNSSRENDIVLDPFVGSGTTCVACINTNRRYIGYELDTEYFKIAEKRIQNQLALKEKIFN